jgi:hypothetical protein
MSLNLGALSMGALCQDLELRHQLMSFSDQQTCLSHLERTFAEVTLALQSVTTAQPYA